MVGSGQALPQQFGVSTSGLDIVRSRRNRQLFAICQLLKDPPKCADFWIRQRLAMGAFQMKILPEA